MRPFFVVFIISFEINELEICSKCGSNHVKEKARFYEWKFLRAVRVMLNLSIRPRKLERNLEPLNSS